MIDHLRKVKRFNLQMDTKVVLGLYEWINEWIVYFLFVQILPHTLQQPQWTQKPKTGEGP